MHNDYTGTDFELDDVVIWTAVDDPQTGRPTGKHFLGKVVVVLDGEVEVEPFNESPGSTWMDGYRQPPIVLTFPTRCETCNATLAEREPTDTSGYVDCGECGATWNRDDVRRATWQDRIDVAAEKALEAFWSAIASQFPNTAGDWPGADLFGDDDPVETLKGIVAGWANNNVRSENRVEPMPGGEPGEESAQCVECHQMIKVGERAIQTSTVFDPNGEAWQHADCANSHHKDSDCTVDPATNLCTVCGADHSQPCPECSRKAFHTATCGLVDNGNTHSSRRER